MCLTLTLAEEVCGYSCSLPAVGFDDVKVRKQVQSDPDEELAAEQSKDSEVNIGQLSREWPELLRALRHG